MSRAAAKREATSAPVDLDLIASQIHVALTDLNGSEAEAKRNDDMVERHATAAESARSVAARRRVELGGLLLRARPLWPERGTGTADHHVNGKLVQRWGEFLALVAIEETTARRYMAEAADPDAQRGGKRETGRVAAILAEVRKLGAADRESLLAELKPAAVSGGSGETDRGTWITAKRWADAVGRWDLDPFSNPRSHIVAEHRCMLEDGGDGLCPLPDMDDAASAGAYRIASGEVHIAGAETRVWIQPPYEIVEDVIAHYGHTRFCALLRLDASTGWFARLWERTQVIALAKGTREFFEPPPGVKASGNPQPHAFFYADPRDVTPAIAESCIVLSRYEAARHPALHVVH